MRRIIDGKMYDTDKSEIVYIDEMNDRVFYRTKKGTYFVLYKNGEMRIKNENFLKELLEKYDVDKYIELFGEVEEG